MCPRVVFLGTSTSRRIDGGVLVCIVGALNGGIPYNTALGSMPRKLAWEGILYGLSCRILYQVVFDGQRCIMPSESVLHLLHSGVLRHAP